MDTSKIDKLLDSSNEEDWQLAIELLEGDSLTDLQRREYLTKYLKSDKDILKGRDFGLFKLWLKYFRD